MRQYAPRVIIYNAEYGRVILVCNLERNPPVSGDREILIHHSSRKPQIATMRFRGIPGEPKCLDNAVAMQKTILLTSYFRLIQRG